MTDRTSGRKTLRDRTLNPLQIDADTGLAFITFRVPPELIEPLVERAQREGLSVHMKARTIVLEWCRDEEAQQQQQHEKVEG